MTDTVGFAGPRDRFDEDGDLVVDPEPTETATTRLLDDLARFTERLATDEPTTDIRAVA